MKKLIQALNLQGQGQLEAASKLFNDVLKKEPKNPTALYSLALIALNAGKLEAAIIHTKLGVTANPNFAPLAYLHGAVLQALGRQEEALESYNTSLNIKPDALDVLLNSGALLRAMFRHKEALERFNKILSYDPNHAKALANCGIILTEFKESGLAIAMFERLLKVDPDFDYAPGLLFYERMHICDWNDFDVTVQRIVDGIRAGKRTCKSLAFMCASDSAADHHLAAKVFASQHCPPKATALWNGERYDHQKIRIAYVSPDFREHPVGHVMAGIYEHHDKSRFETIAISLSINDNSRIRARTIAAFDHFVDAQGMTSEDIAGKIRELEVDIAIDLGGYTSDTRADIFSFRPAPVHINFLGYPGTMGIDYMDYILVDHHVVPPEDQVHFSEKVVYLPDTYFPTDGSVRISEQTPSRADCGLPEDSFVFCSFSHEYKISPDVFSVWMRLLNQVPQSVLWLMSRGELAQANLRKEAQNRGVDGARIIFAGRVPLVEDHLARYRQADLFLDTHPYNAHTTTADALMAGLPVVTFMGRSFPSRVAGSLLHAAGMPELIAESLEGYEALALRLASNPNELKAVKARLADQRQRCALFDTERFCRNLEHAYVQIHNEKNQNENALPAAPVKEFNPVRRLHIGGREHTDGWEMMNVRDIPGTDHIGNANDMERFADNTFEVVYSSHVLEHMDYQGELQSALQQWLRVLKPGGSVEISVPNLEALSRLILNKELSAEQHFHVMRIIFGGHMHPHDYHLIGFTPTILRDMLVGAGFTSIEFVEPFTYFADNSGMLYAGELISLNVRAKKPYAL
jgi:predicted O-linked N-acetylglucosamine transferase (SPINDLY family)/predicted SAM-dependent methyltransferase